MKRSNGSYGCIHEVTDDRLARVLDHIVEFYDGRKVGYEGFEGYRKSTDLAKFIECVRELRSRRLVDAEKTVFADLGCADGRVNVIMSFFVKKSIGIEIDPEILSEYEPGRKRLDDGLRRAGLGAIPKNIHLFEGSTLAPKTFQKIAAETGVCFHDVDIFYTYITLHDLFAEKIAHEAKRGALYIVYGFSKILPRYRGLELLEPDLGSQGIAALYGKL